MRTSVVIPTYNYGHFLREAIESVQRQTLTDFEIIVVDDGSTDDTPDLLASIEEPRLVIVRTPNRGLSAARNEGLERARGEYIAFLDADDRWRSDKLERQVQIMEAEPDVVAVFTNFIRFDASRVFDQDQFAFFPELPRVASLPTKLGEARRVAGDAFCTFIGFGEFPTWLQTMLLRLDAVRDLRFIDAQDAAGQLVVSEDGHYCFRAFRRGGVAYIREPLVEVRRHEANTTKSVNYLDQLKLATVRALESEDLTKGERAALNDRIGRAFVSVAAGHAQRGEAVAAIRALFGAVCYGCAASALKQMAVLPVRVLRSRRPGTLT